MSAISTARHNQLMERLKKWDTIPGQREFLQEDVVLMQQIHERYQNKLSALRRLIQEYEIVQRRVRMGLRKQQIEQTRQKQCS